MQDLSGVFFQPKLLVCFGCSNHHIFRLFMGVTNAAGSTLGSIRMVQTPPLTPDIIPEQFYFLWILIFCSSRWSKFTTSAQNTDLLLKSGFPSCSQLQQMLLWAGTANQRVANDFNLSRQLPREVAIFSTFTFQSSSWSKSAESTNMTFCRNRDVLHVRRRSK